MPAGISFCGGGKDGMVRPASGPGSDVRAAKALRIDATNVVQHGMPSPDPIHPGIAFLFLTAFTAAWLAGADVSARYAVARRSIRVSEVVSLLHRRFFDHAVCFLANFPAHLNSVAA